MILREVCIPVPLSMSPAQALDHIGSEMAKAMDLAMWKMIADGKLFSRGWGMAVVRHGFSLGGSYNATLWAVGPGYKPPQGTREVFRSPPSPVADVGQKNPRKDPR